MQLNIGIDCDEVLSETIDEMLKFCPELKGIQRKDITSYDIREIKKLGLSIDVVVKTFYTYYQSPEYFSTPVVSGAYDKLLKRKQEGHNLFVVTARPLQFEQRTREWIEINFKGLFSDVLFMDQFGENETPKSELCLKKGIQLLIDDVAHNIYDVNSVGIPGFLLDKPRNQGIENSDKLKRVFSWDEIQLSDFFNLIKQ